MKIQRQLIFCLALSAQLSGPLRADEVIASQTNYDISGGGRVPGQSFTTPNNGIVEMLTEVDFGKAFGSDASGSLFLLDQPFLGLPTDLSSSTPGYLAASGPVVSSDFNAAFQFTGNNQYALQPDTEYWVYGDAATGWNLNWSSAAYAGGIGGLLSRSDANGTTFYHADGNGNITMLINNLQLVVAKYIYDPFGNTLSMYGSLADANLYRFSSKEWNVSLGLHHAGWATEGRGARGCGKTCSGGFTPPLLC